MPRHDKVKKKGQMGKVEEKIATFTSRKPRFLQLPFQLMFDYKPSQKLYI
jgi:hypothetical protein